MAPHRAFAARPEHVLAHAQEPMYLLSSDRRIAWVNRAWEELTGHAAAEVLNLPCGDHGPTRPGDPEGLGGSFAAPPEALAGQPCSTTTLILHPAGERLWRRLEFWPLHDDQGRRTLLGIVRPQDAPALAPESPGHRLHVELLEVRERLLGRPGQESLVGVGPAHRRLQAQIAAAAASDVPVLVVGEPGNGKRTVARAIHAQGAGRLAPLLVFDCRALPPEVLERELFLGRAPLAEDGHGSIPGGAVLLVEAFDIPRDLQLRVAHAADHGVRLLATTFEDPEEALRADRIRPEFFFAMTALVIRLRPLRQRLDELPLLAQHLLERANLRGGRQHAGVAQEALDALAQYDWPGNVRELARVVDAAHARGEGDVLGVQDLPPEILGHLGGAYLPPAPPPVESLDAVMTRLERRMIELALQQARQNKSRAADLLGISRPRLYRRIKELNIPDEPEPPEENGGA